MVVEEKFLGQYDVPALMAVGWEGVFGMGEYGTLSACSPLSSDFSAVFV